MLLRLDLLTLGLATALKLARRVNFGFCGVSPGSLRAFLNKSLMLALAAWAGRRSKSDSGSEGEGGITMRGSAMGFREGVSNRLSTALRRWVWFDCVLLSGDGKDAETNLDALPTCEILADSSSEVF